MKLTIFCNGYIPKTGDFVIFFHLVTKMYIKISKKAIIIKKNAAYLWRNSEELDEMVKRKVG